eukprot:14149075-Heterocapsa_arctica.AAC.1
MVDLVRASAEWVAMRLRKLDEQSLKSEGFNIPGVRRGPTEVPSDDKGEGQHEYRGGGGAWRAFVSKSSQDKSCVRDFAE